MAPLMNVFYTLKSSCCAGFILQFYQKSYSNAVFSGGFYSLIKPSRCELQEKIITMILLSIVSPKIFAKIMITGNRERSSGCSSRLLALIEISLFYDA
jgi:hypothetical protein